MSLIAKGILVSLLLITVACGTKPGDGEPQPGNFTAQHMDAVEYVKEIDSIRSTLASGIAGQDADAATFVQVCKPVGKKAQELSEASGWKIQQLATKYRNPAHKADEQAALILQRFEELPELEDVWERITVGPETGWRYFAPIHVESACLACHGEKDSRPEFVVQGYPQDTAFDFEEGDLRGLYSVFVPDSTISY